MSYFIEVYCTGRVLRDTLEPSHPDRRAFVTRLEFVPAGTIVSHGPGFTLPATQEDMWVPHRLSRLRDSKERRRTAKEEGLIIEYITDDGRLIDFEDGIARGDLEDNRRTHMKYLLRCGVCGLDYQFREETLSRYFNQLREAGWNELTLASLGAIL